MKILNETMTNLVEKYVKHYKTDLEHDYSMILDNTEYWQYIDLNSKYKQTNSSKVEYVWILRECGTQLLKKSDIFLKDSDSRIVYDYYVHNKDINKIYNLIIKDAKKDTKEICGEIKELKLDKFNKEVLEKTQNISVINSKVFFKDNRESIEFSSFNIDEIRDNLYKALSKLKINIENVRAIKNFYS